MKNKKWYEVYGDGPEEKNVLLAKVTCESNARRIAEALKPIYTNVRIK